MASAGLLIKSCQCFVFQCVLGEMTVASIVSMGNHIVWMASVTVTAIRGAANRTPYFLH